MWKISTKGQRKLPAFSLIEIVTALAFISVVITTSYGIFRLSLNTVDRARQYTIAELMAHDLIELTTSKRNENWNSLELGEYHFVQDPLLGTVFIPGPETIDEFTRSVTISNAYRDLNGHLTNDPAGEIEPDGRYLKATVSWQWREESYEVSLDQFVSNWKKF